MKNYSKKLKSVSVAVLAAALLFTSACTGSGENTSTAADVATQSVSQPAQTAEPTNSAADLPAEADNTETGNETAQAQAAAESVSMQEAMENGLLPENTVYFSGFEDNDFGFKPRGASTDSITLEQFHEGDFGGMASLKITGRTEAWEGTELDITGLVQDNSAYTFSVWCRVPDGQGATVLQLSTEVNYSNGAEPLYKQLYGDGSQKMVTSNKWIQLEGYYPYQGTNFERVTLYIESIGSETAEFYIDDAIVTKTEGVAFVQDIPGLKDIYADYFIIGAAGGPEDFNAGMHTDFMLRHFNAMTGGNLMKPDALQGQKGEFTFNNADRFADYIEENNMTFIGHTLAWHNQSPEWMNKAGMGRDEAIVNLTTHVKTVVEHFKGRVYAWDVVNEAFQDGVRFSGKWQDSLRKSPWYNAIGDDYLEIALKAAREADPDVLLIINDYNLDYPEKAKAIAAMYKDFKERGVPIDMIGMQGHYNMRTSAVNVENSIKMFVEAGAKICVTEFDLTVESANGNEELTLLEEQAQAVKYGQIFDVYKRYAEHIDRVTIWGFKDDTSWRAERFPLPFDKNYQAKLAYYAMAEPEKHLNASVFNETLQNKTLTASPAAAAITAADLADVKTYVTAWETGATGKASVRYNDTELLVSVEVSDASLELPNGGGTVDVYVQSEEAEPRQFTASYGEEVSGEGYTAEVQDIGSGYRAEFVIPFESGILKSGAVLKMEFQITDIADGTVRNIAKWTGTGGDAMDDTDSWGIVTLK
ncbi:MAG: endo-1,4-beta-xylanase [Clostridiales bacterium]|jgi:endo-1,4-beta-xylanase|nr:endo-1,4-beta-xylanase [Clostridiales bacterium]